MKGQHSHKPAIDFSEGTLQPWRMSNDIFKTLQENICKTQYFIPKTFSSAITRKNFPGNTKGEEVNFYSCDLLEMQKKKKKKKDL